MSHRFWSVALVSLLTLYGTNCVLGHLVHPPPLLTKIMVVGGKVKIIVTTETL